MWKLLTGEFKVNIFKNKFVVFFLLFITLIIINWFFTELYFPTADPQGLWFYSGIIMVLFSILFVEPYYTSPKNVIANTLPLLLVFTSIQRDVFTTSVWGVCIALLLFLLILSIIVITLEDATKSPSNITNRATNFIKKYLTVFGRGKIIYSGAFILFLFLEENRPLEGQHIVILAVWAFILLIDPKQLHTIFALNRKNLDKNAVGRIFGIQSEITYLIEIFGDKKIEKFSTVQFRLKTKKPLLAE